MARILLVAPANQPVPEPPAALVLLPHQVEPVRGGDTALHHAQDHRLAIVDGRVDLTGARATCQLLSNSGSMRVAVLVATSALSVLTTEWGADDFILDQASPAEFDARIRLLLERPLTTDTISGGPVSIDEAAYTVTVSGRPLDLTYTEFELLKYMVQNPNRVLSREKLLSEVWGYDYYGGTRTVDVHIRRLRAKLGAEFDYCIGTVRNVGYRFCLERQ